MQWSTEKAGDFLITAWMEECEVGGCAKACSVQVRASFILLRSFCRHLQGSHLPSDVAQDL